MPNQPTNCHANTEQPVIVPIPPAESEELVALARKIYAEHYLHLWEPGGAEWYMQEEAYASDKIKHELADPDNLHFKVIAGKEAVGYLKLRLHHSSNDAAADKVLEIERIYLLNSFTNSGIGKKLMEFTEQIARKKNCAVIILKAMDSSDRALNFYHQNGYRICGNFRLNFPLMKAAYRGMVVLQKQLNC
ncbi:MAG: hypothetical protein RLZZ28_859 [Bacteroidota bacterium]|jgi:diamine N-acetyltransferase